MIKPYNQVTQESMSSKQTKAIKFDQVDVEYKSKVIFDNCNFSLDKNQQAVIFGKSGSGKSTLLKLILGFEQPLKGKIYINGLLSNSKNIQTIRQQIAYVDQDVVFGEGTVQDVFAEYFSLSVNKSKRYSVEQLKKYLAEFELEESILDEDVNQLSGGERQRLGIIMAIMLDRPVMLMDEVTSSLDPTIKKQVIKQLTALKDKTILIVTHDQEWRQRKQVKLFNFKDKKWER